MAKKFRDLIQNVHVIKSCGCVGCDLDLPVDEEGYHGNAISNTRFPCMFAKKAKQRPSNYNELSPEEQWAIDKELGILDWKGDKK